MKVIEDNWGSFPRTETCSKCKSKVEIENRKEIDYLDTIYLEDCIELPEEISCNCGEFIFYTEWIDMDWEKYFEEVKETKLQYIKSKIDDIENNLANEKARYEKYNNLTYKEF